MDIYPLNFSTMYTVTIIIQLLSLVVLLVVFALSYHLLRRQHHEEIESLKHEIERAIGLEIKTVEIRDFYEDVSNLFDEMLKRAYEDRDKRWQSDVQKLREKLERLKARVVDKTTAILSEDIEIEKRKRRRKKRRKSEASQ